MERKIAEIQQNGRISVVSRMFFGEYAGGMRPSFRQKGGNYVW